MQIETNSTVMVHKHGQDLKVVCLAKHILNT